MFKIWLASHGGLCRGMLETAKLFTQDVSMIQTLPFYDEDPGFDVQVRLEQLIQQIQPEDVVIVITDILWGSVNQKIMMMLSEWKNVHIITGMNLPLLLEMITMNPETVTPELISEKVTNCRSSIMYMREVTVKFQAGDE